MNIYIYIYIFIIRHFKSYQYKKYKDILIIKLDKTLFTTAYVIIQFNVQTLFIVSVYVVKRKEKYPIRNTGTL